MYFDGVELHFLFGAVEVSQPWNPLAFIQFEDLDYGFVD